MYKEISDKDFLSFIDWNQDALKEAKAFYQKKQYGKSALLVVEKMLEKPFVNPLQEDDFPYMSKEINSQCKEQVVHLRSLADNYLLRDKTKPKKQGKNAADENYWYSGWTGGPRSRGGSAFMLSRLYYLTNEKKYMTGAINLMKEVIASLPEISKDESPAILSWHPHVNESTGHTPGHIAQELSLMLPFVRRHLSAEDALIVFKGLLYIADFVYRGMKNDFVFNIPFHLLTGSHLVGVSFPEFKDAPKWKKLTRDRMLKVYAGLPNVTKDGYFREGLSYQAVVHNLILRNIRFWKADGQAIPKKIMQVSEKSFEFAAAVLRNDGFQPLIADSWQMSPHEYHIQSHQILHLAAAEFNRPDFKAKAGNHTSIVPLEQNIWHMGKKAYLSWKKMKAVSIKDRVQEAHFYKNTGFQVLGGGKGVKAHYGLLHNETNINHSHHDAGSIDISGLGRPLITDPGVDAYLYPYFYQDQSPQYHSQLRMGRFVPLGPRVENPALCKTTQTSVQKNIQVASIEHHLYESFSVKRTLCYIKPKGSKKDDQNGFWLVLDSADRRVPSLSEDKSHHELVDTPFHFLAPETNLGIDGLSCWSKNDGKDKTITRYALDDPFYKGKGQKLKYHDVVTAQNSLDNNANMQITCVPQSNGGSIDLVEMESYTLQYGGRVKRPAGLFRFSGPLPYLVAYVMVPFKGVRKTAIAEIEGTWKNKNADITVRIGKEQTKIRIEKGASLKPVIQVS